MAPADLLTNLAPKDAVPAFRSAAPLAALGLGPEEGFVLSRIDGHTRLGELINLVPFPPERTVEILRRLWIAGAIEIPGHEPPVILEQPVRVSRPRASATTIRVPHSLPPDLEISLEQAQHIDTVFAGLATKDAFELLGLPRGCDKKEIKRAYFKLSKEFHPDRFYGKKLGVYQDRVAAIFQAVKGAFELLSDDERRAAYEDSLGAG
ncbi:MAG TPA: J domain-containing protein [Planctomycetota bacterium]|nr:J domain-containing protein [Planctomycetota bacterium]